MKQELFVFLAMCALAYAFAPRDKRAVEKLPTYCEGTTPCGWVIYNPLTKNEEATISNTYCKCESPKACERDEDVIGSSAFIYRCRRPENTAI